MRIDRKTKPLTFTEDGDYLSVAFSNRGEPYREGVEISFSGSDEYVRVLLDVQDVKALRDKLSEFLGKD